MDAPIHYENMSMQYTENFLVVKMKIFPRRGGSNEYPQSMFWNKNKKNRYTLAYHIFTV